MGNQTLELTQPSGWRRDYQLRQADGTVVGRLHRSWSGYSGTAEAGDRRWKLERKGFFRAEAVARDAVSGSEVARLVRSDGRRRVLRFADGRELGWAKLSRKEGSAFVREGQPIVTLRLHSGLLRSSATVSTDGDLPEPDRLFLALFGSFLLLLKADEDAAAASAPAAAS